MLASPCSFSVHASSPEAPAKPKQFLVETADTQVDHKGKDNSGVAGNDVDSGNDEEGDSGNDYHWGCFGGCGFGFGVNVGYYG